MGFRPDWSWKPPIDLLGYSEHDLRLMKARRRLTKIVPPIVTEGKHKEFYTGEVPPWDKSLGAFVCFEGCCGRDSDTIKRFSDSSYCQPEME